MATDKNDPFFARLLDLFQNGVGVARKVKGNLDYKPSSSVYRSNGVNQQRGLGMNGLVKKNTRNTFNNTMNPSAVHRFTRYQEYEAMEEMAEINTALTVMAAETVAVDDKGKCFHIQSDNERIKELLSNLFYDVINIEFNAYWWVRSLCKTGDFAFYNRVDPKLGVTGISPIPINEIERDEDFDPQTPELVRFTWQNQTLESYQITHMRLIGNDAFLPFGTSMIEGARRAWRQLLLAEDSMLVYRVVRSPERRVFYIDVGNIPNAEVGPYMEQMKNALKGAQVVDPTSGRADYRYSAYPIWSQSPIPLLDGRTITIAELAKEYDNGKENWVYSVQDKTHEIVPGKVIWCGKNYTAKKLVKVWLDDGTWCLTAPEHPFLLRDGAKKNADQLESGDALMPLYTKLSSSEDGMKITGYPMVYNPASEKYEFVHRMKDYREFKTKIFGSYTRKHYNTKTQQSEFVGYKNHKVDRIEFVDSEQGEDVYCMTVVGPNGEQDRHNFGLTTFDENNCQKSGIIVVNSQEEDFLIPVRGSDSATKIDTLKGGENTTATDDVEYLQRKLFSALHVPKAFLGYDESLSSKSTLALQDVRFSRTIAMIQKVILAELNKLAFIHLFAHGFSGEDLVNFDLQLSNPSTIAQQQKLELLRSRLEILKNNYDPDQKLLSREYFLRNIMGLSESEIEIERERIEEDKKFDARIEAVEMKLGRGSAYSDGFDGGTYGYNKKDEKPEGESENTGALPEPPPAEGSNDIQKPSNEDEGGVLRKPNGEKPIKAQDQVAYNRSRRRTHGADALATPDFKAMFDRKNVSLKDIYDKNFLGRRDPFGESFDPTEEIFSEELPLAKSVSSPTITKEIRQMLKTMDEQLNISRQWSSVNNGLLAENKEDEFRIPLDFGKDD
jgi:hypothetical protein